MSIRKNRWEFRKCPVCKKNFLVRKVKVKKHCSRACCDKSEETRKRCSIAGFASAKSPVRKKQCDERWEVKICPSCKEFFRARKVLRQTFCSKKCASQSVESRERSRKRLLCLKKPMHAGFKHSPESKYKMRVRKLGKRISAATEFVKKGVSWKRSMSEYVELHELIKCLFGKPGACEFCGSIGRNHWASIDHVYTIERKDWKALCLSCHSRFDGRIPLKK